MPKPNRSESDSVMRRILLDIEKCQQALNHKRANLAILPMEIDALETKISTLKEFKKYLEKM